MREVQDHFFKRARAEGYRSRAAYKLLGINNKRKLLSLGDRVLDCGAAPGSWLQVASKLVGPRGSVLGVDLTEISPHGLADNVELLCADVLELTLEQIGGEPFDVVLSDMAPSTTGTPSADHHRSAHICEGLLDRLNDWLKPGGNFVMKTYEGERSPDLLAAVRERFERPKGFKPPASRSESVEFFLVGHGFQPLAEPPPSDDPRDQLPARPKPSGWGNTPT